MKVVSNLFKIRTGRALTRLFYLIPGCIFLYLILENHDQWYHASSLNVPLLTLFGIPAIIFAYQGIRNSILGWWLVLVLYMIYGLEMIQRVVDWYSLVGAKNDLSDIPYWLLFLIIYLLVGVLLVIMKPRERYF